MDFLTTLLANFIDSFKAKNPKIFAVIALILTALMVVLQETELLTVIGIDGVAETIAKYVTFLATLLLGSRTFEFKTKK